VKAAEEPIYLTLEVAQATKPAQLLQDRLRS
jgi:hypothetical protein